MTTLRSLLSPGYEPGDGTMDGAQLVDGHRWHPCFGCDSLQYVVDNARQAVEALQHQWPEPITDRRPTEEDGDYHGYVQYLYAGKWSSAAWDVVADTYSDWLHTPSWRPKPEPTLKQQALEIVNCVFFCTPKQAETLLAALALIPDTTP